MGYESRLYVAQKGTTKSVVYDGEFVYDREDDRYYMGNEPDFEPVER